MGKIKSLITLSIITAAMLFNAVSCMAEDEIRVDPTGKKEGFSAVLYDNTNGLPTSEANTIAETEEGFIWIGSYSGLIRYDGNTFERVDSVDTGIANVLSLYADEKNRLWIGTNDRGLVMMDKGVYRSFNREEGLNSPTVRSVTGDGKGYIYVGTSHGLSVINEDLTLNKLEDPQIYDAYIRDMQSGKNGVIYGVTWNGDVFTLADGKLSGFYSAKMLGVENVISIYPDEENPGYVYLGTEGSIMVWGNLDQGFGGKKVITVSPLSYVNSIREIGGQFWICADNGIGMTRNGVFEKLESIPLNNSVEHIMIDYEGNLWFTSSRQGVMKIVPNRFSDLFKRLGLEDRVVNSTCLMDNRLFIATDSGLIVSEGDSLVESIPLIEAKTVSGKELESKDLMEILEKCRIRSIIKDKENRLWFSTYGTYGLVRYDNGRVLCFTEKDGLPSDRVRTCFEAEDGTVYASCSAGGVAEIKGDTIADIYDNNGDLQSADVLTIEQSFNGDLMFGTDGDGIFVIRGNNIQNIGTDVGLESGVVMRLKRSVTRDVIWIVTSNSLAYMDADLNVTTIKRFPYSNNFDMYENSRGEVWILSSNGVYVVKVDDLLENGDINPVFYDRENGLPCITTANSFSELTEDGDLYICGSTGVAKVNIEKPFEDVKDVKVAVPYVKADGQYIYAQGNAPIVVPQDVKKLTIYPFVYTYSLINPLVTYYLEGFDKKANSMKRTELGPVDYTNLKGGNYRFVINLKDALGKSENTITVNIVKKKAVYEMLWFRILAAVLFLLFLVLIVRSYVKNKTKRLERKQEENKLFIREMIGAFAKIIDMKDTYTRGHSTRVADYTVMLAKELGYDEETVEKYHNIALLHDIGKIGVPPEVLNKPGQLTDEEFKIIKSHSALGYAALKDISIMPELAVGAGAHHERPDGKGYPKGLKEEEIPRVAQIIAVADTFDAMYSDRPYRKRMNFDKVVSIIKGAAGTQLAENVVEAFLKLVEKGEFRDPDDHGGGTFEDIDNIRKSYKKEEA